MRRRPPTATGASADSPESENENDRASLAQQARQTAAARRAASQAAVARSRAEFFATGGGAGASRQRAPSAAQDRESARAGAADEEPREQWPGPMATARQLLAGRAAARAAREEETSTTGEGHGTPQAGRDGRARSSEKRRRGADGRPDVDEQRADTAGRSDGSGALREGDFAPTWKPSRALPAFGQAPTTPPTAVAADDRRTRRSMAVAGPSGVRTAPPPLATLAMETLAGVLADVALPDVSPGDGDILAEGDADSGGGGLGLLTADCRRRFAAVVCRARRMDGHAFRLIAAGCGPGDELDVPDCAGVDESALRAALLGTSGLTALSLGHCGRGFTLRTVDALIAAAPRVLGRLQTLRISGATVLTDAALVSLLRAVPPGTLQRLAIAHAPSVTGAFMKELPAVAASLVSLEIMNCPAVSDASLAGVEHRQRIVNAAGVADPLTTPGGAGALNCIEGEDDGEPEATPGGSDSATRRQPPAPAALAAASAVAEGSGHVTYRGGILSLTCLRELRLEDLPNVSDTPLAALFASRRKDAPRDSAADAATTSRSAQKRPRRGDDTVPSGVHIAPQMSRIGLVRCPRITGTCLATLADAGGGDALVSLELTSLPALDDDAVVTVRGGGGHTDRSTYVLHALLCANCTTNRMPLSFAGPCFSSPRLLEHFATFPFAAVLRFMH